MIKDQIERDRMENDLDTNFLIEAGAGSGKTRSMVQRMISLIRNQKANINQIAAITFTNKATAELKSRFILALEKAVRNAKSDEEAVILQQAYENVNQCFIGTIHSFCGSLLRERPLEAGLDPSFTEMEESDAKEYQNSCWDDYLTNLMLLGRTTELEELASFGIDSEMLREVYHRMCKNSDVEIYIQAVPYPNFHRVRSTLLSIIEEAKVYFPTTRPEKGWDTCQKTMLDALQLMKVKDIKEDLTVLQLAESFDKKLDITLNRWTDSEVAKEFRDERIINWQDNILRPFLRSWREFIHPKIVRFVLPIVDYCQERKQERGLVDFQDLLLKSTKLLREHEDVRRYFKKRYTHLLVDEYQDTDPVQAEMMLLLTGKDSKEKDWRKQVPENGSLFIVGDPKQSIYRFRRADISTYHFMKKKIEENGEVLRLTTNFRSVKAIGEYVDKIFESKFFGEDQEEPVQASFAPMNTIQPNPDDLYGVYAITHEKVERHKQDSICEMDSEKIASFIAWACEGNLQIQDKDASGQMIMRKATPGDFLILLKQKAKLHVYAEKLEKYGILSDISGSVTRYEELLAFVQLVKSLNDPSDPVALLAVLRGLFFGCSDEELYRYNRLYPYFSFAKLPDDEQPSEACKPVFDALIKLKQYHQWLLRMPALTAFMKIIEDIGLLPYSVVQLSGLIRAGTIVQILERVQDNSLASASWNDLTKMLLELLDEEKNGGVEGTGLFLGSSQAVRIMNLHKAKGLEAPVVFLAAPFGESEHKPTEHIDRKGDKPLGFFVITKDKKVMAEPFGWTKKEPLEQEYMEAEEDRLLYVAATRPKQLLIISRYPAKNAISPWEDLSFMIPSERELRWEDGRTKERKPLKEVPDFTVALSNWRNWLEFTTYPSFEKSNVTSLVKGQGNSLLPRAKDGKGPIYGTVVHRCMEEIGKGLDQSEISNLVTLISEEEGLGLDNHEEVVRTIHAILKSEIWERGQNAKQRYHEFSILFQKENKQIQGVIDFLFEEEDGWVIVDYKTDTFAKEDQEAIINYYRPQVELYSKEWEETFKNKVKEKGLYFTMINQYVVV